MYNEHTTFEFDPEKEAGNFQKHGVSFEQAIGVFGDPHLINAPDLKHSQKEERWYVIGRISDGRIITVWYTLRGERARIIGAAELRKGRKEYEKRKIS